MLHRIRVCERALAGLYVTDGRGRRHLLRALREVRAEALERLRELGYPLDEDML